MAQTGESRQPGAEGTDRGEKDQTADLTIDERLAAGKDDDLFYKEFAQIIFDAYLEFGWGDDEASESSGEQSSENSR